LWGPRPRRQMWWVGTDPVRWIERWFSGGGSHLWGPDPWRQRWWVGTDPVRWIERRFSEGGRLLVGAQTPAPVVGGGDRPRALDRAVVFRG
jgi:hypothetical protein